MEISNKFLVAKTWGSLFIIRLPGAGKRFFMLVLRTDYFMFSIRIWKAKLSFEWR
jgi:hypothetical protein